jgi:hypothetical protein
MPSSNRTASTTRGQGAICSLIGRPHCIVDLSLFSWRIDGGVDMPPDKELRVSGSELALDEENRSTRGPRSMLQRGKISQTMVYTLLVFFRVQSAQIPPLGKVWRIPGISCFIANCINTCERTRLELEAGGMEIYPTCWAGGHFSRGQTDPTRTDLQNTGHLMSP